ncbi:right-handed parallel beta-helix repeat-containing protein [Kiritimatiellaeota bacterium B1221]|nr:right-handed parallel beta-helix repeat-containing protein [Kiritimatiellaeota bacterium B1221]
MKLPRTLLTGALLLLQSLPLLQAEAPRAVATFQSLGLYWKPDGGSVDREVRVHYRKAGAENWREAMPLWFDDMQHDGGMEAHSREYRGSIVQLDAGSDYEVKLKLQDGEERILQTRTRSDKFKIARTVSLPASTDEIFTITEGGSESEGYVLYEAAPDAVWDADNQLDHQVKVDASYVILRGLHLKGAIQHGIVLGDVTDVVIEHCEVSGWGRTRENGEAVCYNAAVFSQGENLERITIQYNDFHHPRSDSNSWKQRRPNGSFHPEGPAGIAFFEGQGGHVIRFNRIYSDMEHMFYDVLGGRKNFSYSGFPVKDTDIHDNFISHSWDDGLEIEGADMNVRIYNNYIDMTYGAIGAATASLGPLYIFRNVYAVSRKHEGTDPNSYRGHYLVKIGNENLKWTHGRIYIFHNTSLQPPPFEGFSDKSSGAQAGIAFTSKKKTQRNIVSRNNLIHLRKPSDWAIRDTQLTPNNDYDYDMHDGKAMYAEGNGRNNIQASPVYRRRNDGLLELVPGSPGHDAGQRLPNFNDDFAGKAPDMGAVETAGSTAKPELWPEFPKALNESEK